MHRCCSKDRYVLRWWAICLLACGFWSLPLSGGSDPLRFDHLSIEDGLSQSVVLGIIQDHKGFIWLATQDGLNRFDGYHFLHFKWDPEDPTSISDNYINTLYEDQAGFIWLATASGLNRFNPLDRSFTMFDSFLRDAGIERDAVLAITGDALGNLWLGMRSNGLFKADPMRQTFTHYQADPATPGALPNGLVRDLLVDREGVLWVATRNGLARMEEDRFQVFRSDPNDPKTIGGNHAMCLFEDSYGLLWVGTSRGGLSRLDRQTGEFTSYRHNPTDKTTIESGVIRSVIEDETGMIWVGSDGGVCRFDRDQDRFERVPYFVSDSGRIKPPRVFALLEDRGGAIWVGTEGASLYRYDRSRSRFTHYYQDPGGINGLNDNTVLALFESPDRTLWIGTDGGGLNRFDRNKDRFEYYLPDADNSGGIPSATVFSVLVDHQNFVWVGTRNGLARLDLETDLFQEFTHPDQNGPHQNVLELYEDRLGRLWAGTFDGLDIWSKDRKDVTHISAQPNNPKGLSDAAVVEIVEDGYGDIWMGTLNGGLNRYRDGVFKTYRHDPNDPESLSQDRLWCIFPKGDVLWIGSSNGLNQFRPKQGKARHYGLRDGLPNETIFGILEDESEHLWLSSNKGLIRFDPRNDVFKTFATHDGLQSDEFAQGSFFKSPSGEMFFGGINGFNAFFPSRIKDSRYNPPIVISDLQLFNLSARLKRYDPSSPLDLPIEETSHLVLDHQHNVVAFEFAALHYAGPRRNQYAYRLEGFDEDWVSVDASRRFAVYTNLRPGDYQFRVKGSNKDGYWSTRKATLKLTIRPPWWRTRIAYVFYALILAGLIYTYIHQQNLKLARERRIAEQERHIAEQERQAAEQQRRFAEQQRQVAEKDRHMAEQERLTNQRLREVDKLKDEFLANTSHELRTPLHGIIGLTESLLDGAAGPVNAKTSAYLSMVISSGKRLANLVNDILDFSKLKDRNLDLNLAPVDFRALTDVVLTLSRPLLGTKNLELINNISPQTPPVLGDEDRLQQIMHNLVGNAVKFTHEGRIEVGAEIAEDGFLAIYVEDTGMGISEDKFAAIFAPFEQADGTMSRTHGGTGLGLAVSKQLLELQGGRVSVRSKLGQGTRFTLFLPISDEQPEVGEHCISAPLIAPVLEPGGEEDLPPVSTLDGQFHILVVDDEPVNRQVLMNQLALRNYNVTQSSSGQEALDLLEDESLDFDMVLLDLMMPGMSGYEVCRAMRERFSVNELPIILLTAKNQVSDLVAAFSAGANDYLTKPISKNELLSRVATHLRLLDINRTLEQKVADRTLALESRKDELETLDNIVKTVNREIQIDLVFKRLMEQGLLLFPRAEKGALLMRDVDGMFRLAGSIGYGQAPLQTVALSEAQLTERYTGPYSQEIEEGIYLNAEAHASFTPVQFIKDPLPKSQMVLAIRLKDRLEGFMVWNNEAREEAFDHSDVRKLDRFREHAATAILKARLVAELHQKNEELVRTQKQLVSQQKLASLGTLTAGIAHEIRNPLNFINNFASTAVDLVEDLEEEYHRRLPHLDQKDADLFRELLDDLKANADHIFKNGQRANIIVESMMDLAKGNAGDPVLTDLNKLAAKYAEIACNGRTMDGAALKVTLVEDLDQGMGLLSVVPQNLSRVIVNLVNNAVDALSDWRKKQGPDFNARITVGTKETEDAALIWVEDNGPGIPKDKLDKIFDPFFTTKSDNPNNIGLGLSLSYDLVAQEHGELLVDTEAGHFTRFTISLRKRSD